MSDAATALQALAGETGTLSLYPGAPYESFILSLFADAAYGQDESLTQALDGAGFSPLTLQGMTDGTYVNENAAFDAWVDDLTGSEVIIAFRGTDDLSDASSFLASLSGSADVAGWTDTAAYYDLLSQGIAQVDAYVAANDVSLVYVTGHSLGGATTAYYMMEHPNSETTVYLGESFGAPGILTPGDIDLSAGFPPYSAQFYEEAAQAALDADPRLTMFVIDEDPAAYFGVKTGGVGITYDYSQTMGPSSFTLTSFLEDPASYTQYHDLSLYMDAASNYGDLLSGATTASDATVSITVDAMGASSTGVLAFAS